MANDKTFPAGALHGMNPINTGHKAWASVSPSHMPILASTGSGMSNGATAARSLTVIEDCPELQVSRFVKP